MVYVKDCYEGGVDCYFAYCFKQGRFNVIKVEPTRKLRKDDCCEKTVFFRGLLHRALISFLANGWLYGLVGRWPAGIRLSSYKKKKSGPSNLGVWYEYEVRRFG